MCSCIKWSFIKLSEIQFNFLKTTSLPTEKDFYREAAKIYESLSSKIQGVHGYVDLTKFVNGKNAKSGYSLSKTKGNPHGQDAIWKLLDAKGNRVATLDSNGKILRD